MTSLPLGWLLLAALPWIGPDEPVYAAGLRPERAFDVAVPEHGRTGWPTTGPAEAEVAQGATWSVMVREWLAAQDELGLQTSLPSLARLPDGTPLPRATLAAYLSGDISHLDLHQGALTPQSAASLPRAPKRQYGGFYHMPTFRGYCAAAVKGVLVLYLRIYKSGNNAVCANLARLHDGSIRFGDAVGQHSSVVIGCPTWIYRTRPARRVLFTATVEPTKRFVSGYGEIALWRTRKQGDEFADGLAQTWFSYLKPLYANRPEAAARAFLHDVLTLRLGPAIQTDMADIHAFPQVSFMHARAGMGEMDPGKRCALQRLRGKRLDLHGDIAHIDQLWQRLGARVGILVAALSAKEANGSTGSAPPGALDSEGAGAEWASPAANRSNSAIGGSGSSLGLAVASSTSPPPPPPPPSPPPRAPGEPGADALRMTAPAWWRPFDFSHGKHPHLQQHRDAMDALLRTDAPSMRAVCRLYLPDYACFNYSLPPACAGLDRHFRRSQLGRRTVRGCPRPIVDMLPADAPPRPSKPRPSTTSPTPRAFQ
jgi:hypothetical protein